MLRRWVRKHGKQNDASICSLCVNKGRSFSEQKRTISPFHGENILNQYHLSERKQFAFSKEGKIPAPAPPRNRIKKDLKRVAPAAQQSSTHTPRALINNEYYPVFHGKSAYENETKPRAINFSVHNSRVLRNALQSALSSQDVRGACWPYAGCRIIHNT